jgi:hypothetical protein
MLKIERKVAFMSVERGMESRLTALIMERPERLNTVLVATAGRN